MPPLAVADNPVPDPLHTVSEPPVLTVTWVGWLTTVFALKLQPLLSVNDTVYVPVLKPLMLLLVPPVGDHE